MLARRHWFTLASALISIVTIYLLYQWLRSQGELRLPSGREAIAWMSLGVVVYLCSFLVRGLRWKVLLDEVGVKTPLHETTGLLTVGYAANTLLPARAGDAVRVFLMAQRTEASASLMVSTLIAERLLDVAVLGIAFVVTSLIFAGGLPAGNRAIIAVALLVVALIGLLVVRWAVRSDHVPAGVRGILRDASLAVRQLRGSRHLAMVASLTCAAWFLEACVYWIAGQAAGIELHLGSALYILSTAAIFTMIPSGPGFAGTMDAAIAFTLHVLNEPKNLVGTYIFTVRFLIFIPITIVGGVLLIARYGGMAALRAARSAQEEENEQAEAAAKANLPLEDLPTGEMAAIPADTAHR
jgi:glycosyltransferase 2 family protein